MEQASRPKARRLSLTKKQREAGAGLELLSLLLSVSADGQLTPDEVVGLKDWLAANGAADLPAIGFLRQVVDQVLADGKVTAAESDEIWEAVLRVLPPEDREVARGAHFRLLAERDRVSREAFRARVVQEQAAAGVWDFMVAGVAHGRRALTIEDQLLPGDPLQLVREPDNAFDANAIHIRTDETGDSIGYVPAVLARRMAPMLDEGRSSEARCKKILTGNTLPIPVVVVTFSEDASRPAPTRPSAEPTAAPAPMAEADPPAFVGPPRGVPVPVIVAVVFAVLAGLIWAGLTVLGGRP